MESNTIQYPRMAGVKEAASLYDVSPYYIRNLARAGKIRFVVAGHPPQLPPILALMWNLQKSSSIISSLSEISHALHWTSYKNGVMCSWWMCSVPLLMKLQRPGTGRGSMWMAF